MAKRSLILFLFLLLTPILVFAQDEEAEAEEIAYLRLNSNFSVPGIPDWEVSQGDETALFTRDDIQAQIYVRIVETMNAGEAIETAIADVELITTDTTEPVLEGRIGRSNGTWVYEIYQNEGTSITAYALLQSGKVYVVLFAEESADYDAYHLAMRSANSNAVTVDEINEAISPIALETITTLIDADFSGEPLSTRNPAEDNAEWIEATYENDIMTASFLFDGIVYVTAVEGDVDIAADLSNAFDTVFLGFVITPDNGEFLQLGLAFSGGIFLILIASMYLRYINLKKDLLVVEQLAED